VALLQQVAQGESPANLSHRIRTLFKAGRAVVLNTLRLQVTEIRGNSLLGTPTSLAPAKAL